MTSEPPAIDPSQDPVARYRRAVSYLGAYALLFPLALLAYVAAGVVALHRPEIRDAVAIVLALLLPAFLYALARRARPRDAAPPAGSFWTWFPAALFVLAIAGDLALIGHALWDPPCRADNLRWVATWKFTRRWATGACVALYLMAWAAWRARMKAKDAAAAGAGPIVQAGRAFAFALLQLALLVWGLLIPGVLYDHEQPARRHDAQEATAAGAASEAEERYRAKAGRYTDRLEDLIALDRSLAADRSVTFRFSYAGATGFTFTAVHPKACMPAVRRR